ncbi:O-antigen ligase family protein [Ovoidimarina sediminis]|uniref:O-antigen ligase family protein n=1 Tax=Ovoidimarina sediminis TaxID=3079856 RepID=UPI00290C4A9D|nr:O-antigen ligase family protein [Rhodophyticola sp. MJ-SS7]MDU8944950.1 O-antigen ligase family protein [Rhodophyticola sp. MJ-SS7]
MGQEPFQRTQGAVLYAAVSLVLLSVLVLGGNSPLIWSLLAITVFLLFSAQILLSLTSIVPLAIHRLMVPGGLYLAVLAWAWIQSIGGMPTSAAHPLWAYVPDAAASISADPTETRQSVVRLLCYAMIFVMTVWATTEGRRASTVLKVIAFFSTGLAIYALYASVTRTNMFLGPEAGAVVKASFVNRNNYATYVAFGAFANLAAYLHVSSRQTDGFRGRLEGFFSGAWIYAFGLIVCIGTVSMTQSRAGGIAGLVGLAVFLLAWRRDRATRWDMVMLGLLVAVLIFIGLTSATGLTERLLATSEEEIRFTIYPLIVDAIADRPLFGHGLGAFEDAFRPYIPFEVSQLELRRAHNDYLELAFGLGLPATAFFLLALGLIASRIYRGAKLRHMNRAFSCFALGCAATAAFHSVFDFSLQMPAIAALFAVILGLGYAQSFTHAEKKAYLKGDGG